MPKSRMIVLLAGLLVLAATIAIVALSPRLLGGGDELHAQSVLMNEGALVAMNPDDKHVGTVNLSTIQDVAKLPELLRLIAGLGYLQALDMNQTPATNSDLQTIGNMDTLVSLALKSTKIDDQGLVHLAGLTKLESLHLNGTAMTDAGLRELSSLDNLKVLDLSDTKVESDLAPLCDLANLEWLLLRELSLSDSALTQLAAAPKLKRLSIRGSTFSAAAVEQLVAKRPELRIDQ